MSEYKLKKTGIKKTIAHPDGKPTYDIHHDGSVIGTVEPWSAYKDTKRPGSRIVSSRKNVTKYMFDFHKDMGPKSHEMGGTYEYMDHNGPTAALKQIERTHSRWKSKMNKEEYEPVDEAVLTLQQRRKRGMAARRNKEKLKRARERARRRLAPKKNIDQRAMKLARAMVRKRFAGARGVNYNQLTPSEKIQVDKLLDSPEKAKLIKKLAQRLIPKVKQAEQKRLQSFMQGSALQNHGKPEGHHTMNEQLNSLFSEYFGAMGGPNNASKVSVGGPANNSNARIPDKGKDKAKGSKKKAPIEQFQKFQENTKIVQALEAKAEKHDVDFDILAEVFRRGLEAYPKTDKVTREQYAFARVNSFVNCGKTYFNEDADLTELSDKTLKSYKPKAEDEYYDEMGKRFPNPRITNKRERGLALANKKLTKEDAELQEGSGAHYYVTYNSTEKGDKLLHSKKKPFTSMNDAKRHIQKLVPGHPEKMSLGRIHTVNPSTGKIVSVVNYDGKQSGYGYTPGPGDSKEISQLKEELQERNKANALRRKNMDAVRGALYKLKNKVDDIEDIHSSPVAHNKALGRALRNESRRMYNTFGGAGAGRLKSRLTSRTIGDKTPNLRPYNVELRMKDGSFDKHTVQAKDHHHAITVAQQKDPTREFHPLGGHKVSTEMKESMNQPYVKPHMDSKGNQSAWKASNKHGKVKYFGVDFKDSAKKHAGLTESSYERDLEDHHPRKVEGVYGAKSKAFTRKFKNQDHQDKFFDHPDRQGNYEIHYVSKIDESNESEGSKARQEIQTVPRKDKNRTKSGEDTRHQELIKKIIHEKKGDKPKDREVGTDSLTDVYKTDTPHAEIQKMSTEEARSADKEPSVRKAFVRRNADGTTTTIRAKAELKKSNRKIIKSDDQD